MTEQTGELVLFVLSYLQHHTMDYGSPAPPEFGEAPQPVSNYQNMAIAFGILFAVFFTITCSLIFLLFCIALGKGGNGIQGGDYRYPQQFRSGGPNNKYGTSNNERTLK